MIIKESLSKNFRKLIKETLVEYSDNINIGLEMELQQNSEYTDEIFNLNTLIDQERQKREVVIMKVANYGKDLTVYFYVKKLSNLNINKLDRLFYEYKQDQESESPDSRRYGFGNRVKYNVLDRFKMVEYSEYRTPDIYNEYMDRFYYNFNNNNDFDLKDEIVRDDDIDYNFYYFIQKESDSNEEDKMKLIIDYFSKDTTLQKIITKYGIEMENQYNYGTKFEDFSIERDSSLRPNADFSTTFEFKTPYKMKLREQIQFFKQFIRNEEKQKGLSPNESCGFHVNISFDDKKFEVNSLDYIILFILFDEQKLKINTRGGDTDTIFSYQKDVKDSILKNISQYIKKNTNEIKRGTERLEKYIEIDERIDQYNNMLNELIEQIKTNKFGKEQLKEITKNIISNVKTKIGIKIDVYNHWFDSNQTLIEKLNSVKDLLLKQKNKNNNEKKKQRKNNTDKIIKKTLNEFSEQIYGYNTDAKFKSFVVKHDRIEFRIMGGDYLRKTVQNYIVELQQIIAQQYYKPDDIKKYCYKKQIQMIFNTKNYKNDMNGKIYYYTDYVKSLLKDIKDNGIDKDNMKKNNEKNYDKIINNVQKQKQNFLKITKELIKKYPNLQKYKDFENYFMDIPLIDYKEYGDIDNGKQEKIVNEIEDRIEILKKVNEMDFLDFKKLLFDKINEIKNNNLFESKDLIKIFDI